MARLGDLRTATYGFPSVVRFTVRFWPKSRSSRVAVCSIVGIVVLVVVATVAWDLGLRAGKSEHETNWEAFRTIGLLLGGFFALWFGIWRASVAERQVDAAQKQMEAAQLQAQTTQMALLNDRYQRASEMLGSETLAVRLGGIYALRRLAEEHPNVFHAQCMELLCAFVRNPTRDANVKVPAQQDWHVVDPRVREDVQAAISFVGLRGLARVTDDITQQFDIDLRGANLAGADLSRYCLDGADLTDATLAYAKLGNAFFADTIMTGANLVGARMEGVILSGSNCKWATFESVHARSANFSGACLEGAVLTGARLQGAVLNGAILIGSDLQGANLAGANLSGAILGKGQILVGEPPYELINSGYTALTQEQLDTAVAEVANLPQIDPGLTDASTGAEIVWRGQPI